MKRAALAVLLLAVVGVAACGDQGRGTSGRGQPDPQDLAGVYLASDFVTENAQYAEDARETAVILSRRGSFIICATPGGASRSHPMIGTWRVSSGGKLELEVTHYRWRPDAAAGILVSGCGSPAEPVIPFNQDHRLTCVADLDGASFRWPSPLRWEGSRRPLFVRTPTPAWAIEQMEFKIPDSARFGFDPTGDITGTYSLDRNHFAGVLRDFRFASPEQLAQASEVTLVLRSNGSFDLLDNRGWRRPEWKKPLRESGMWIGKGSTVYLRMMQRGQRPIDRVWIVPLTLTTRGLARRGNHAEPSEGQEPDASPEFDLPYTLVRTGR